MSEDVALFYPLAGLFSVILSIPLLIFWTRTGWARLIVILSLLAAILFTWWLFDLSKAGEDLQLEMFEMTVIPPLMAAFVAGALELKFRADHSGKHRRRRRSHSGGKSRSAGSGSA